MGWEGGIGVAQGHEDVCVEVKLTHASYLRPMVRVFTANDGLLDFCLPTHPVPGVARDNKEGCAIKVELTPTSRFRLRK